MSFAEGALKIEEACKAGKIPDGKKLCIHMLLATQFRIKECNDAQRFEDWDFDKIMSVAINQGPNDN